MNLGLSGKTALVVGAGRGVGRHAALVLGNAGARVIAVARTKDDLQSLRSEFHDPRMVKIVALDLMPEGGPGQLVADVASDAVDIVVHNIGGNLGVSEPLCAAEDLRRVLRFNLEIAAELNRFLIPPMRERRWGRVVHMSSNAALARKGSLAYGVAKAALNAYVEKLGRSVAPDGVSVSAIMPGAIADPGGHWDTVAKTRPTDAATYLRERVAIGRFARPEEVAELVGYLCSEHASLFCGAVVAMDGGGL
jgi:3-oxoacyl-[acyl-carrier protein] reductase